MPALLVAALPAMPQRRPLLLILFFAITCSLGNAAKTVVSGSAGLSGTLSPVGDVAPALILTDKEELLLDAVLGVRQLATSCSWRLEHRSLFTEHSSSLSSRVLSNRLVEAADRQSRGRSAVGSFLRSQPAAGRACGRNPRGLVETPAMASVFHREPKAATVGKRMIITGPDYIKDHLPKIHQHTSYIGEKRPVLEKTGDLKYLWRPAPNQSFPAKYKHEYVGGIGWGVQEYNFINRSRLESGFHIKHKEASLAALDKITHRYQNPWQPAPSILDKQGRYSRGSLAWHLSDHEDTDQRNPKRTAPARRSQSLPGAPGPAKLPKAPKEEEKERG
uniref:Uncharacterized protein n=1 Tax=Oryctolagus cuniculus TaxID=9986 RepID=U3KMR3_RABIT